MIEHFSAGNEYSLELCRRLAEHAEITLLTVDNSLENANAPYRIRKLLCGYGHPVAQRIARYLKGLAETFREIAFGRYDVIHVQTFRLIYPEVLVYAFFRLLGKKIVYTVHNVMPHEMASGQRLFYSWMYRLSSALIVHNRASMDALEMELPGISKKVSVIPHGAYDTYKAGNGPLDLEEQDDDGIIRLLLIGKLRHYKGADILVRAVSALPAEYRSRLKILIAGKQEMEFDLEGFIRSEGAEDAVEFRNGFLPVQEVSRMLGECDACIFPYRQIYGSGALLLAYTFGKPVIASDLPAFIEETDSGRTGLLFRSGDEKDLALKIAEFMDKDEMQKKEFSDNIERLVQVKYNWQNSAKLTCELYESV